MKAAQYSLRKVILALAAVVIMGALAVLPRAKPAPESKPNVLFIAVDDLNDWVNSLGGREGVHTPNIDRLAARGMLFTNAHCSAPSCAPSRASLMTGVRPSTSGVYINSQDWRKSEVLKDAVTLPQHFREHGYRTTGGGKIYHALSFSKAMQTGLSHPASWDDYFPSLTEQMPAEPRPDFFPERDGRPLSFFSWGVIPISDEEMADGKVTAWATKELAGQGEQPFFQAVGIYRPHIPWWVPKEYFDKYPLEEINLPKVLENDLEDVTDMGRSFSRRRWQKWVVENKQWERAVQGYLASMTFADAMVGRLLDALDESGKADNTIIVLWSDHGMHLGEKENWEKFTLWEESTRVPFIIVAPGVTQPGAKCHRPVSLLDIYPTLVDLAGLSPLEQLEGTSLVPYLENPNLQNDRAVITTWKYNNHSVRSDRWRYIRYQDGTEELYDHENDSDEFTNLAGRAEYKSVKKELAKWLPKINSPLDPQPETEPW